jgi:hypothetical protein
VAASGSVVNLWGTASSSNSSSNRSSNSTLGLLESAGELYVGKRQVTALSAAGAHVAVGCSDGSTLVWRHHGSGKFAQQALVPAALAAAVTVLSISSDATLMAAASGAAVAICCPGTKDVLTQQVLPSPPAALFWAGGGSHQLLVLLHDGSMQPLDAPDRGQPAAAGVGESTAAAGAGSGGDQQLGSGRRSVRFAEAEAGLPAGLPAPPTGWKPEACASLPPLPAHPLLRGGCGGAMGASRGVLCVPGPTTGSSLHAASICRGTGSAAASSSQLQQHPTGSSVQQQRPHPTGSSMLQQAEPLYPILDLRALRGLPAAAAATAGGPPQQPAALAGQHRGGHPPAARSQAPSPYKPAISSRGRPAAAAAGMALTAVSVEVSTTRSARHVGTCTEPGAPDMSDWQWAADEISRPVVIPAPATPGVTAAAAAADEEEAPRQARLPSPVRRQQHSPSLAVRVSKQQCEDCKVLAVPEAAAAKGSDGCSGGGIRSRPASPSKASMLATPAALSKAADSAEANADISSAAPGGDSSSSSRPASPLKLGVACTAAAQQDLGELQPPEVKPFTGEQESGWGLVLCSKAGSCAALRSFWEGVWARL